MVLMTTTHQSGTLKDARRAEAEIRSLAAFVVNEVATLKAHPTYGRTKTGIRQAVSRLDGMVALYAVLTDQANFWSAPSALNPEFLSSETDPQVVRARAAVRSL